MAPVRIDLDQRRALVAQRHRLTPDTRCDDPVAVTESVVALHATDPATVFLSLAARSHGLAVEDMEHALYEDRVLDRVLGMRRTLFVVVPELRPVVHAACTDKIALGENRRLVKMMSEAGVGGDDPEADLDALKAEVLEALEDLQPALGREIAAEVGGLRRKLVLGSGKSRTEVGMTTLVLSRMAMDGTISRTRPTGSWLSSQFRYELVDVSHDEPLTVADASALLAGRYLARFGPATVEDCQWWAGWTKTQTRKAIEAVGAVAVEVDSGDGVAEAWVMPEVLDALAALGPDGSSDSDGGAGAAAGTGLGQPWVTFLPALDPTTMGWKERGWYLGEGSEVLFDRFGNAGPTVWAGGDGTSARVVGGWGQRPDGTVVFRLLEPAVSEVSDPAGLTDLAEVEAARIGAWLGGTVVSPRFRAPLERELSS